MSATSNVIIYVGLGLLVANVLLGNWWVAAMLFASTMTFILLEDDKD